MATVTKSDLQEIKDLIKEQNQKIVQLEQKVEAKIDKLDQKIERIENKVDQIDRNQLQIKTRLEDWKPSIDKIPDLAEKVGELKNWRSIALVVISGVLTTLFWFLRNGKL